MAQQNFIDANICVAVSPSHESQELIRQLQRLRTSVTHVWPMPVTLPLGYQVIYCEISSDLPNRIPWLPGQPESALVLVDRGGLSIDKKTLTNCAPQAVLHYPANSQNVYSTLQLSLQLYSYEKRLRDRVEKLDENLKTVRQIERAKAIVMQQQGCTEKEAYDQLRDRAMEKRVTVSSLAHALVASQSILG